MPEQAEFKRRRWRTAPKNSASSLDDASHRQENHKAPILDPSFETPRFRTIRDGLAITRPAQVPAAPQDEGAAQATFTR